MFNHFNRYFPDPPGLESGHKNSPTKLGILQAKGPIYKRSYDNLMIVLQH